MQGGTTAIQTNVALLTTVNRKPCDEDPTTPLAWQRDTLCETFLEVGDKTSEWEKESLPN
jgi:hypothetical protein